MGLLNKPEEDKNDSKTKGKIKKKVAAVAVTIAIKLIPLLIVVAMITSIVEWVIKVFQPQNTVNEIYKKLEIEDVCDLIEIKGNSNDGYYLDFTDDVDEKLDDTIDYLNRTAGVKSSTDKEFLKKVIKAEVCAQFPDLGANVDNGNGFQGIIDILRIMPNKKIGELKNTGAGQETIKDDEDLNKIDINNKDVIEEQEKIIKKWSKGKELTLAAKAFVYSQEDSTLHPGEKIDYWTPQKNEKTQKNLEIQKNETVKYTGKYSISVNKMTNEGLIYVGIKKDDIKGYIKYNFIVKDSEEDGNTTDEELVDTGYSETTEEKVTDTIDSNVYKLTYIPKEEFDKNIENANKDVLYHFTIDDDGNLITATWSVVEDGTLELTNNSAINLKSALQNYIVPYAYLMYFYMEADYKDFSSDLADKVFDSKIIIALEDNVTTTQVIETIEEKKVSENSSYSKDWNTKETPTETLTEYCSTKIEIIYADTWCAKMIDKGIYKSDLLNVSVGQPKNINMPGTVTDTTTHQISEERDAGTGTDTEYYYEYDDDGNIIDSSSESFSYIMYERTITDTHSISNSYSNGDKDIIPKENVFVDLYKRHKMYNRMNEKRFLDILEKDSRTANLLNLTKYLIYLATGVSYDEIKEYDFEEFSNINIITIGKIGASYKSLNLSNSDLEILYKITSAERGGGTQEQQEYVVSVILNRVLSSNFPNTVYDVVFAPMQFQPTRNGAYEKANPSQTTIDAVNNVIETGDKSQCAVYFMTPGASLGQPWLSNCEFLFNDTNDSLKDTNTGGSHNFYTTKQIREELQQYMTSGNGSIVDSAIAVHKYVRENNYVYNKNFNKTVPNTSGKVVDCSSFVTWVLVEAGVQGFSNGMSQWGSSTFYSNPYGWEEVSTDNAQPGDILVYSGHVEILADKGTDRFIVYNCGGNSSIKATCSANLPESSTGRNKSSVLKILRVP